MFVMLSVLIFCGAFLIAQKMHYEFVTAEDDYLEMSDLEKKLEVSQAKIKDLESTISKLSLKVGLKV